MLPSPATIRSYKPDDFAAVVRLLADLDPWKRLKYTASDWERLFEMPMQGREAFRIRAGGRGGGVGGLRHRILFGDHLEPLSIPVASRGPGEGPARLAPPAPVAFQRGQKLLACPCALQH